MGAWSVTLPKLPKSFEEKQLEVISGNERKTLNDVLIGELWICGGQSNMAWTLNSSRDSDLEIASANTPHIRFIRVPLISRGKPQTNFPELVIGLNL